MRGLYSGTHLWYGNFVEQAVINSFISVALVSAVSLVGIFALFASGKNYRSMIFAFVSLSVGVLFGDVLLHILPDLFVDPSDVVTPAVFVFAGILVFFLLEKYLHFEHEHGFHDYKHEDEEKRVLGPSIIAADTLHNFLDGLIITASFLTGGAIGLATTLAVVFHEIPHEIGNVGVLLHAGYSKRKAFLYNVLTAVAAFAGLFVAVVFGKISPGFTNGALALAAGGFIYIAGSELVPELHKESRPGQSAMQFLFIVIGFVSMFAVLIFE
jgi:zinc and cadmium transporter